LNLLGITYLYDIFFLIITIHRINYQIFLETNFLFILFIIIQLIIGIIILYFIVHIV